MWSAHKNTNNKTSVGFFGLSCYCRCLFSLPIQEKLLLNFIPKAQELVKCFFFSPKDKFHFPVLAVQKDVYWGYQLPPVQLSIPLEGAHGEIRSHIICVSLRRKMEKFDLTQGKVGSLQTARHYCYGFYPAVLCMLWGRFRGHSMICR